MRYCWRSPAWQVLQSPGHGLLVAVRAFPTASNGGEDDLATVAAKAGFFCLDRGFLTQFATHMCLEVRIDSQTELFDLLFSICKASLEVDDSQVMEYLRRRMSALAIDSQWSDEFNAVGRSSRLA